MHTRLIRLLLVSEHLYLSGMWFGMAPNNKNQKKMHGLKGLELRA